MNSYIVETATGNIVFNGTEQDARDLARMNPGSSWDTVANWRASQ